jgi:DNA-binding transcriptional MerR regulator
MKAPDAFRTISEVAEDLDLPQHVLRFWETRFAQIKPMKRGGGRRYYRPEDIHLLRGIRLLLYSEGFTIRGVQRLLKERGVAYVASAGETGSVQALTAGDREGAHEPDEPDGRVEPLAPLPYLRPEANKAPTTDPDIAAAIRPADTAPPSCSRPRASRRCCMRQVSRCPTTGCAGSKRR